VWVCCWACDCAVVANVRADCGVRVLVGRARVCLTLSRLLVRGVGFCISGIRLGGIDILLCCFWHSRAVEVGGYQWRYLTWAWRMGMIGAWVGGLAADVIGEVIDGGLVNGWRIVVSEGEGGRSEFLGW